VSKPQILNATTSCDWLTRTFSEARIRDLVWSDFHTATDRLRGEGHEHTQWSWMGYEGLSIGGMSWGHRTDGDILRLSGGTAERLFDVFAHYQGNCSRIDIALTVFFDRPSRHLASRNYQRVAELQEPSSIRTYSLIVNSSGGETMYVGSRQSDQFGRLYDKASESKKGDEGTAWRWEVEFKADRAKAVLQKLTATRDRSKLYLNIVSGFFQPRQVDLPAGLGDKPLSIAVQAVPTSDDTQLSWLARQVRPVVKRLVQRGRGADVIEALRLEEEGIHASTESPSVQSGSHR